MAVCVSRVSTLPLGPSTWMDVCGAQPGTPYCSITSISPHWGQPAVSMLVPRNHHAGQMPGAFLGSLIRALHVPFSALKCPWLLSRAEVYPVAVFSARITRGPRSEERRVGKEC